MSHTIFFHLKNCSIQAWLKRIIVLFFFMASPDLAPTYASEYFSQDEEMEVHNCFMKAIAKTKSTSNASDEAIQVLGYRKMIGLDANSTQGIFALLLELGVAKSLETDVNCSPWDDKALTLGKLLYEIKLENRTKVSVSKFTRAENGVQVWLNNETNKSIQGLIGNVMVEDVFGEVYSLFEIPKYTQIPVGKPVLVQNDFGSYLTKRETEFLQAPAHSLTLFVEAEQIAFKDEGINPNESQEETTSKVQESSEPLTLDELAILREHISSCWQPPAGTKGVDLLKVDIHVKLERDGYVKQAEIEDQSRYSSDLQFRAAANAARRAVLDCQPLPLPSQKYEFWKEFIFGFDPKFM